MYLRNNAPMDASTARLLMSAILSDTLNLQGPTTTDTDRFAVALLAKLASQDGVVVVPDDEARLMFRAKTRWIVNLSEYAMVNGDHKHFCVDNWRFGISVLEVTEIAPVLEKAASILDELRFLKVC
jgi:manganese-dependent inorganic pyrophosphatase